MYNLIHRATIKIYPNTHTQNTTQIYQNRILKKIQISHKKAIKETENEIKRKITENKNQNVGFKSYS